MNLGMNISGVSYWQSDLKFRDLMLASSPFHGITPATPVVPMNGKWPVSLAPGQHGFYTLATEGYTKPGIHTLTAQGQGTVKFVHPDIPVANQTVNFTNGESYTFNLSNTVRSFISILATNPSIPLKNIQVLAPGTSQGVWHSDYIDSLKDFNTIRFMDYQNTNSLNNVDQQPNSIANAIDLCNTLNANPWFCLPITSLTATGTTDYVPNFANQLNNLDPGLTAYIEPGNEIWNWAAAFASQTGYVAKIDPTQSLRTNYALLANNGFNTILANTKAKIKRVLSGQFTNPWTITTSIKTGYPFDAIACAPYCGSTTPLLALQTLVTNNDISDAIDYLILGMRNYLNNSILPILSQWYNASNGNLLCYEMGPGLTAYQSLPTLLSALYADPRFGSFQLDYLTALIPYFSLVNYYSHCRNDIWGALQTLGDTNNQRFLSLQQFCTKWN